MLDKRQRVLLQAVWEPSHKDDGLYCQVSATCERSDVAFSILKEDYIFFLFKCLVDLELTNTFHFPT